MRPKRSERTMNLAGNKREGEPVPASLFTRPTSGWVIAFLLLFGPATFLHAQGGRFGEDQSLHIPPKLLLSPLWSDEEELKLIIADGSSNATLIPLPVIFFDHPGDITIPSRYHQFTSSMKAADYADTSDLWGWGDNMRKYYELLDIMGYRMRQNPSVSVGLRGGYSMEAGESPATANQRAEMVRNYLVDIWRIDTARLPILSPERDADSLDHSMRQEEARRVTFVTRNFAMLRPVDYHIRTRSLYPLQILFVIDPLLPADRIASLEIIMTSGDEVIGRAEVAGHPDSSIYRLQGSWWYGSQEIDQNFKAPVVELLVTSTDGKVRRSNPVVIPISRPSFNVGEDYEGDSDMEMYREIELPFYPYRDTLMGEYQKRLVDIAFRGVDSGSSIFVQGMGMSEGSEDYQITEAEVQNQKGLLSSENEYYESQMEMDGMNGMLYIYTAADLGMEDGEEYYEPPPPPQIVEYATDTVMAADVDSTEMELEQIASYDLDSLSVARSNGVIAYLRDSLGYTIANDGLDSTYSDMPWLHSSNARLYYPFYTQPEQRWYNRGVTLTIQSKSALERIMEWHEAEMRGEYDDEYYEGEYEEGDYEEGVEVVEPAPYDDEDLPTEGEGDPYWDELPPG